VSAGEFVQALDIGPDELSEPLELTDRAIGAVVAGSIVVIDQGVTGQHQQDVLQSLLLAQLAANAKADRHKDPTTWYRAYQETLTPVGWVVEASTTMTRYQPPGTRFTVPMVITDLFKRKVLPEELALIAETLSAFKRDAGGPAQFVFECPSHAGGIGNFQVGLVTEEDGVVSLRLGRFSFITTAHVTRLILEEFPTDAQFQAGFTAMTLNEQVYATVRSAIAKKVESRFSGSVAQVELTSG
jgi:hypothetical protein